MILKLTVICPYCGSPNYVDFDERIERNPMICEHCILESVLIKKIIAIKLS